MQGPYVGKGFIGVGRLEARGWVRRRTLNNGDTLEKCDRYSYRQEAERAGTRCGQRRYHEAVLRTLNPSQGSLVLVWWMGHRLEALQLCCTIPET